MPKETKRHYIDITDSAFQIMHKHAEKLPAKMAEALRDLNSQSEERKLAFGAVLIPGLLEQAITIYRKDNRRAVLIFDQYLDEMNVIYLAEEHLRDLDWVLPHTLTDISSLLKTYNPSCEVAVIMLAQNVLQIVWVRSNGNLHSSGSQPLARTPNRPFAPLAQELVDEIAAMYSTIHKDDEPPNNPTEQQAAKLKLEMQNSLQKLIMKGMSPITIELSLFYHWLKITTLSHGYEDTVSDKLLNNLTDTMAELIKHIEKISAIIKDTGPSQDMKALGDKIQEIKNIHSMLAKNKLDSQAEIRRHTEATNEEIFYLVCSWLKAEINPRPIDTILLYFWLRTSTINANVPEPFFQKIEHNWEDVVAEVNKFIRLRAKNNSTTLPT